MFIIFNKDALTSRYVHFQIKIYYTVSIRNTNTITGIHQISSKLVKENQKKLCFFEWKFVME